MSDHPHELMPRKALYAIAALILFSLVLVTVARLTGLGISQIPPEPVVQTLDLRFDDRDDGAILVRAVDDGRTITVLAPGSNQFLRGVRRATARARRAHGAAVDAPFQIARLADGRLTLRDLATGQVIELRSFGPTNEGAFATLLAAGLQPHAAVTTDPQSPVTAAQTPQAR